MRKIHDGPIFSICVMKDGSVITGGGKDSRIVKFDTMYRKIGVEAQLPEHLGSIRIISQGRGSQLLLGTTRNSILSGNFDLNFQAVFRIRIQFVRIQAKIRIRIQKTTESVSKLFLNTAWNK